MRLALASLLVALPLHAAELSIPATAALDLGGGSLALACADLTVDGELRVGSGTLDEAHDVSGAGTLHGESGTLHVTGDWGPPAPSLVGGSGTVAFVDGCGETLATVHGSSTFATLRFESQTGKEYRLAAGTTQTASVFAIEGGGPGNRVVLRSDASGVDAYLDVGSSSGSHLDVDDVDGVGNTILVGAGAWIGPNAMNWLKAIGVPALGAWGGLALPLALAVFGARRLRASRRAPGSPCAGT
ncbi:MAG: hypothetical protein ACQGVC_26415 [Myxococcota bacterium]